MRTEEEEDKPPLSHPLEGLTLSFLPDWKQTETLFDLPASCVGSSTGTLWFGGAQRVQNYFSRISSNQTLDQTFILKKRKKKEILGKMCLLMFACLLVYLFICLFIIWKWHYKLLKNMPLLIQINLHFIHWFKFSVLFFCLQTERQAEPLWLGSQVIGSGPKSQSRQMKWAGGVSGGRDTKSSAASGSSVDESHECLLFC